LNKYVVLLYLFVSWFPVNAAKHISQKPKPDNTPVTIIESYASLRISLLAAVSDSTTMISGALTFFRPFILTDAKEAVFF